MNYPKTKCDTVIAAMRRDGHADLLEMVGLAPSTGHNTRKDRKSAPEPVTREPLWETPTIGKLSTGRTRGDA